MTNPDLHPLTVIGVRQLTEEQSPVLVMQDDLGRGLEIGIGLCEALALQLALNKTIVGRPLTHELILSIADHLEAQPAQVVIDDVTKHTYFARLIFYTPDGEVSLDCRPSDGITLALRSDVPIMATDSVMQREEEPGEAEEE